ncbi:hypothetical protein ACSRUE_36315 [Sorangium sp. KYC3313]|uniref:hypothetical protein n=1 Tax=Sorangium sp. KYC3313 TaxID=3449740 RepID=UPI003F8C2C8D
MCLDLLGRAAAEASRRARHELLAGQRGTSLAKSTAALRLDQLDIDGPELAGVHLDLAAAPPPSASRRERRPLAGYRAPSSPALSTGVQSPAPDVALDTRTAASSSPASSSTLRSRCPLRGHVRRQRDRTLARLHLDARGRSAGRSAEPALQELAGEVTELDQVDGDGPELARRFYLE